MININVIVINEFLVSLLRSRRPDIVFQLWDHMEMLYGILPNDSTLNIVMKSAILAMKLDNESVRSTFQHMTLNSLFHRPKPEPTGRTEVISDIMQKLEGRRRSSAVGIWRNAPAWAVARQLFRDVLVGNWPWLQQVPQPATAIRTADAETAAFYPLQEFAQSMSLPFSSPKTPETLEQGGKGQIPLITEAQPDQKLYSSIVPTDVTFTPYIQLLGLSSLAREIPEALAWMRALKIHPSKKTLSIALVFWAEVSLRGPLFEDWAEKNSQSEYGRLLAWIRDWVGDEQTPTEWDIQRALRAVAKMRDDSFGRP
ncbi:hypothetical protein SERLA73DRAFT_176446 [Serpula lacrymans var. lacrymans S7.3]|uniref:Uncharacterized protein n=2 Tax=Serpula lacrymans var. lacrymans TaxID=341189 RepID=F8PMX6_SERL3|nr:hypothetical protein SERLA73DRAFT_176446 [Serpula lacrymans var. lacrymans S7.3]